MAANTRSPIQFRLNAYPRGADLADVWRMTHGGLPELAPAHLSFSGLGLTGYPTYFGLLDVGLPQTGETVVVPAAADANEDKLLIEP